MSDPLRATSSVTTKSVYGLTADHGCEHRLASFHEVPSLCVALIAIYFNTLRCFDTIGWALGMACRLYRILQRSLNAADHFNYHCKWASPHFVVLHILLYYYIIIIYVTPPKSPFSIDFLCSPYNSVRTAVQHWFLYCCTCYMALPIYWSVSSLGPESSEWKLTKLQNWWKYCLFWM